MDPLVFSVVQAIMDERKNTRKRFTHYYKKKREKCFKIVEIYSAISFGDQKMVKWWKIIIYFTVSLLYEFHLSSQFYFERQIKSQKNLFYKPLNSAERFLSRFFSFDLFLYDYFPCGNKIIECTKGKAFTSSLFFPFIWPNFSRCKNTNTAKMYDGFVFVSRVHVTSCLSCIFQYI